MCGGWLLSVNSQHLPEFVPNGGARIRPEVLLPLAALLRLDVVTGAQVVALVVPLSVLGPCGVVPMVFGWLVLPGLLPAVVGGCLSCDVVCGLVVGRRAYACCLCVCLAVVCVCVGRKGVCAQAA